MGHYVLRVQLHDLPKPSTGSVWSAKVHRTRRWPEAPVQRPGHQLPVEGLRDVGRSDRILGRWLSCRVSVGTSGESELSRRRFTRTFSPGPCLPAARKQAVLRGKIHPWKVHVAVHWGQGSAVLVGRCRYGEEGMGSARELQAVTSSCGVPPRCALF